MVVIPPVVVDADVPDRAVTTAAVLIEPAMMRSRRGTGMHSCDCVGGNLILPNPVVNPDVHDFCAI